MFLTARPPILSANCVIFFSPRTGTRKITRPCPKSSSAAGSPGVYACGVCHRADGPGGPENCSLAGLPQAYIVEQLADFKSEARKSSEPRRAPPKRMTALAQAATDSEIAPPPPISQR